MNTVSDLISILLTNPLSLLTLFMLASILMIWRLHAMESKGFEGTVLGTLIMPYCSGSSNLIFAYVMSAGGNSGGNGGVVLENCIVNNVTNLTLILGLAAILCPAIIVPKINPRANPRYKKKEPVNDRGDPRIFRLELLFTLIALFLFTGTLWALAKDGVIDFYDGLVLVGLFLFWQILHVFEILKNNIRKDRSFHWTIVIDLLLIAASAYAIYVSVDHLVTWVDTRNGQLFNAANLGWLSGTLMVLPNAMLAIYYAHIGRQDIVVSSQVGDGHICIPMCVGLFALFDTITVPAFLQTGILIILGAGLTHFLLIALFGRTQRLFGYGLLGAYGVFLYQGIIH